MATFALQRNLAALDAGAAGDEVVPDALAAAVLWTGIVVIVGLVLGVVVAGAIVALADAHNQRMVRSVRDAVGIGLARSGATLGASVLVLVTVVVVLALGSVVIAPITVLAPALGSVLVLGFVLLVGLAGAALSYLVVPVAVLGEQGAFRTLGTTLRLARRRARRMLGVVAVLALALVAVAVTVGVGVQGLDLVFSGPWWVGETLGTILLSVIAAPVTAVAAYVVHLDASAAGTEPGSPGATPG
jgi:hypothetical protein